MSRQIKNFDTDKWRLEGYDVCLEGIPAKFHQNPSLLGMLCTTYPKIIVEATYDKQWGTGIPLRDTRALDEKSWTNRGWLSNILMTVHEEGMKHFKELEGVTLKL